MKRTPWFDATKHKPVRVGFYERTFWPKRRIHLSYWDGASWETWVVNGVWCDNGETGDRWRGLTRPADDGGGR